MTRDPGQGGGDRGDEGEGEVMDEREPAPPSGGPPRVDDMNALLNSLRAVAREDDAETARFPVELTPSLSEATREQITAQILKAQARDRQIRTGTPSRSSPAMGAATAAGPDDGDPVDDALAERRRLRAQSRRSIVMGGGGLALAAAAALMLWMRPTAEPEALPAYSVTASGGVAEVRGGAADSTLPDGQTTPTERLRAASELRVTCRPDVALEGPVAARAFFVQGTTIEEVKPRIQVAATGAVELRLPGSELTGRYQGQGALRVVIGRPDTLRTIDPRTAAFDAAAGAPVAANGSDRRWLTVPLDLSPL